MFALAFIHEGDDSLIGRHYASIPEPLAALRFKTGRCRHASKMPVAVFCVSMALSLAPPLSVSCHAVALEDFTGYSQGLVRGGDVVVNFAVLTPGDSFLSLLSDSYRPGTGATNLDSHQFTYLYQIANNSGPRVFDFVGPDPVKATTVGSFDNGNPPRICRSRPGRECHWFLLSVELLALRSVVCGRRTGKNLDGSKALGFAGYGVRCPAGHDIDRPHSAKAT